MIVAKVMLIDDDESIQLLVGKLMERSGYEYCCAGDGETGLAMLRAERPDLLILDVMLPDMNGFEICEQIRSEGRRVSILFLTAKGDIVDKSIGFKAGADDYLVKPFAPEELTLRINACLRRRYNEVGPREADKKHFRVGDLEINFGKYDVRLRGQQVTLSSREVVLLETLASDPGSVFTRDQLLERIWGDKDAADPNSITVFVRKIREKIEDDPSHPKYLITVWRVGYKIADRV